jgi:hypothetical protein
VAAKIGYTFGVMGGFVGGASHWKGQNNTGMM